MVDLSHYKHYLEQTKNARKLYIGGIPPNYTTETELREFLNFVISKGLSEDMVRSYIVSLYVDTKKWFAFMEVGTVELATACLELDGIVFKKIILKCLRVNEYKPEMNITTGPPITLDLRSFQFGFAASPTFVPYTKDHEVIDPSDARLNSLINVTIIRKLKPDSIAIVGFPYESNVTSNQVSRKGASCSNGPECFRHSIRNFKRGYVINSEYNVDLSQLKFHDIGDIPNKASSDPKSMLGQSVTDIISRGSIPFVVGGSRDTFPYIISSSFTSLGSSNTSVVNISPVIDTRVLDDVKFCPPRSDGNGWSCNERYVHFGAQGVQCPLSQVQYVYDRDGVIVWLKRDLHPSNSESKVISAFRNVLYSLMREDSEGAVDRNIFVTINCNVICFLGCESFSNALTTLGLTVEEILDICYMCGCSPSVAGIQVTEFSPDSSDTRYNFLLADMFYKFSLGFATRPGVALDQVNCFSSLATTMPENNMNMAQTPNFINQQANFAKVTYPSQVVGPPTTVSSTYPSPHIVGSPEVSNYQAPAPSSLSMMLSNYATAAAADQTATHMINQNMKNYRDNNPKANHNNLLPVGGMILRQPYDSSTHDSNYMTNNNSVYTADNRVYHQGGDSQPKSHKSNKRQVKNNNGNTMATVNNNYCDDNANLQHSENHHSFVSNRSTISSSGTTGSRTTVQSMNTTVSSNDSNQPFYMSTSSDHNVANQSQRLQFMYDNNQPGYYGANRLKKNSYSISSNSSDDSELLDADFHYISNYCPNGDVDGNNSNVSAATTSYSLRSDNMKESSDNMKEWNQLAIQQQVPSYYNYNSYAVASQQNTIGRIKKSQTSPLSANEDHDYKDRSPGRNEF
eukprot:gene8271-11196_t